MQVRKRIVSLSVAIMATGGLVAIPANADTPSLHRTCRPGYGEVTPNDKWETSSPFYVAISHRTAVSIAHRAGTFEGHRIFPTARAVPCAAATSVAFQGLYAWRKWAGNRGSLAVTMADPTARPYLGVFGCTGYTTRSGKVVETCSHPADRHAGLMVARFTIRRR